MRDSFKPISDFASIRRGASPRPIGDPLYFGGNVGWVKISDVTASKKFLNKTKLYLSKLGESKSLRVDKGDLVMSICGTIGRPIIINMAACIHDGFVQLYNFKNADIEYLYYVLQYSEKGLERKGQPGTQVNLNTTIVGDYEIFAPPLPQQKKIAQILSTCDAVLEQTEAAIAKYQALKQGMLHDLFTRGIDLITGQLRATYEDAPELYKETELGFVPREWENKTFSENIEKNLYGPRFSGADYDENGNVKTIRGMDFTKDGEIKYNQAPIASLPNSKVASHLLLTDDVVMVTTADCGLTAVFKEQNFQFIPSAYSVKLRFNENVNPYFIKYYMQTDSAKRQVNKYIRQGTLGNLPGSDILGFILNLPAIEEQDIIVKKIETLDQKINIEQQTLAKYEQLKAGLMQDLLSGVVGVEGLVD